MLINDNRNGSQSERGPDEGPDAREIWRTLVDSRWLVLGVALSVLTAGAIFTFFRAPVYESSATLRITEEKSAAKNILGDLGSLAGMGGGEEIETEMIVLRSRRIATAVVDSLSLHVELLEPKIPRSSVFAMLEAPEDAVQATFELSLRDDGTYSVRAEDVRGVTRVPEAVSIGRPVRVGDVMLALNTELSDSPPAQIRFRVRPHREAVRELREELRVSRPDAMASVIAVGYRSTDRVLAADVIGAATTAFIRFKSEASRTETGSTVRFLEDQVSVYEIELAAAETQLRSFRERAQVISPRDEATEQVKRLAELQAQRDQVDSERRSLNEMLTRMQTAPTGPGEASPYRQLAAFPTFLSNRAVQDLLQSLTALENERSALLIGRTAESRDVVGLDRRIQEIELQLFQTARSYLDGLNNQLASLDANLARFGSRMEAIPAREVEFARLLRRQELLAEIYTLLQMRLKESEIQFAVVPGDVQIIDPPIVPHRPVAPRPARDLGLAMILGLLAGAGVAFGRKTMDTKVRTSEQAEQLTGGLPVLGTIPLIRRKDLVAVGAPANGNGNGNGKHGPRHGKKAWPGMANPTMAERLVTHRNPRSPVAEAYRALRTNVIFSNIERAPQLIVVTSALAGDGKSTSAANLAITLAQQGSRTLLVDADMRRGLLHQVFDTPREPGLSLVLLSGVELDEAVQKVEIGPGKEPMHFLPTGVLPPNPSELLGSEVMKKLCTELRARYDTVVFDAPPLNLVTDAAVLGTLTDSTLLVTRLGVTDQAALQGAASQLRSLRTVVGGIVLNGVEINTANYGYYGYHEEKAGANGKG
jgi:capsular exopolysaccharide synthesis family protein